MDIFAKSDYIAMLQSCDTEYENASKRANTTIERIQSAIRQLY